MTRWEQVLASVTAWADLALAVVFVQSERTIAGAIMIGGFVFFSRIAIDMQVRS